MEELEYLLLHRGGRGQSFVYELLYDGNGKDGKPFLCGLIEVDKLRESACGTGRNRSMDDAEPVGGKQLSGRGQKQTGRGQVGPKSVGCRGDGRSGSTVAAKSVNLENEAASLKTALLGTTETAPSYVPHNRKHMSGVR